MKAGKSLRRCVKIFGVSSKHLAIHFLRAWVARGSRFQRLLPGKDMPGPERVRVAFEEIGGTFIKFGQMLALQSDLLPLEYCRALFTLFDRVPPFDYAEVEKIFLEDLGRKPPDVYNGFDPVPVATGSIGQVHVATMGAHKIAVKVRRPTIMSDFDADIAVLKFVVATVKLLHLNFLFWIVPPTEEFVAWTQDELDFRREAHYMDELGRNARDNPNERVPTVFWSCTTARILSVEFLEGMTISEYLRVREAEGTAKNFDFDPNLFGAHLVDNFLGDAFRHGMFHADLHPGNLMIMPGNVVGYIDFGISGVLSRYSRRHLIAMTLAYACGDLEGMCSSFFQITTFAKNADVRGFRRGLKEAAGGWYADHADGTHLRKSITLIMLDLLILSRENGIWPQRDIIKYIRSAIALDGLVKTFTPDMDIGQHLEQACQRHIRWESFRNLISSNLISGWVSGSTHLARDGFLRAVSTLDHLGANPSAVYAVFRDKQNRTANNNGLLKLIGVLWIVLCLSMIFWPGITMWPAYRVHLTIPALAVIGAAVVIAWRARKTARAA